MIDLNIPFQEKSPRAHLLYRLLTLFSLGLVLLLLYEVRLLITIAQGVSILITGKRQRFLFSLSLAYLKLFVALDTYLHFLHDQIPTLTGKDGWIQETRSLLSGPAFSKEERR